jgi:hypothetical protein
MSYMHFKCTNILVYTIIYYQFYIDTFKLIINYSQLNFGISHDMRLDKRSNISGFKRLTFHGLKSSFSYGVFDISHQTTSISDIKPPWLVPFLKS